MNEGSHRKLRDECLAVLRANGIDIGGSTAATIEYFFGTDEHVTLHDIEQHLHGNHLPCDVTQVQRTMRLLVDYGFAVERHFAPGHVRYEHLHVGEHHDHLYCLRCGKIIEFCSPALESLQLEMARREQFHAFSHRLVIRGLCSSCFGESATAAMPLGAVQPGGRFRVLRVGRGGRGPFHGGGRRRFAELGIMSGVEGEVLSNHGPMIVVQIGGTRLALRHNQTRRVMVELLN